MKINTFSRLNMKSADLKADIKKLKDEIDSLDDAQQMIEESMGEQLKLFIGEAMIAVDEDTATEYQEAMVVTKTEELDKLRDDLDKIEDDMKGLKSYLYARFGSAINLEEE
jgi:prefoldin subunit 4